MDLLTAYSSSGDEHDNGDEHDDEHPIISTTTTTTTTAEPIKPKMADRRYLQAAPTPSILATVHANHTLDRGYASNGAITLHSKSATGNGNNNGGGDGERMLMNNPLKSQLFQPVQGPAILDAHGNENKRKKAGDESHINANVTFDHTAFEEQRNAFQRQGVALAPDEKASVVARGSYGHKRRIKNEDTGRFEYITDEEHRARLEKERKEWENDPQQDDENDDNKNGLDGNVSTTSTKKPSKRKRKEQELVHDSDDDINYGIWGPATSEIKAREQDTMTDLARAGGIVSSLPDAIIAEREALAERDRQKGLLEDGDRENLDFDKMVERKMSHLLPPRMKGENSDDLIMDASTIFHLPPEEEFNYKGESWTSPPTDMRESAEFGDLEHHTCYVPKKCVHRFTGHNKGVHRIRLSPGTGHLLLSGGLDGKCKVWSVAQRKVMRTYIGHSAAVRDVQFNHDGSKFLSCSFDRFVRLWNTESGVVENTFTNRRVPYVCKFYPKDDNFFVVGCSDNKIVTYDATTGEITQEYNHHLAPVNTITFVENHGTKMITSSDDKKILVWEWDIPTPIKYISDPTMHSMPVITLHPSLAYFAGQSLDNQIVVFQGKDRFAMQKKKKFTGHQVSGYACDIAMSPDGQFLCSGDGNGKLFCWNWKRQKLLQKFRAHDKGPSVGCVWHPVLSSTVFTCGWDGVIKMWQ